MVGKDYGKELVVQLVVVVSSDCSGKLLDSLQWEYNNIRFIFLILKISLFEV